MSMTNDEKHELLASELAYWEQRYPNAFLVYPDGRKVLRDDLIDMLQDLDIQKSAVDITDISSNLAKLAARLARLEAELAEIPALDDASVSVAAEVAESRPSVDSELAPISKTRLLVCCLIAWPVIVAAIVWGLT